MPDRSEDALIALRQILKATEANVKSLARHSGLTASQLMVLQILRGRGPTLAGDLATAIDLRQATVSVLLDKLQERGLVERRRSEEDRRRIWIHITADGLATVKAAPDLLQDVFESRFKALADWEQASLVASLLRVVSLLDAENIDASPLLHMGDINDLPTS